MENLHEENQILEEKEKQNIFVNHGQKVIKAIEKFFSKINRNVVIVLVCILIFVIFLFGMIGFGVYKFDWQNKFTDTLIRVIPYPAAMVGGDIVTLNDWKDEVAGIYHYTQKQGQGTKQEVEQQVLDKLIQQKFYEKLAKGYNIKVNDDDIKQYVDQIVEQIGSEEELEKNVQDLFGWELAKFKQKLVYPEALREKLVTEISLSPRAEKETELQAKKILSLVKTGNQSFEEIALKHSDDPGSAQSGGELGWFSKGAMVPEFEEASFNLEKGQVSDLVKTQFGFHIIKVEDKKIENVDGEDQEQVQAKHILIAFKSFNDYFSELQAKSKVYKFVALD